MPKVTSATNAAQTVTPLAARPRATSKAPAKQPVEAQFEVFATNATNSNRSQAGNTPRLKKSTSFKQLPRPETPGSFRAQKEKEKKTIFNHVLEGKFDESFHSKDDIIVKIADLQSELNLFKQGLENARNVNDQLYYGKYDTATMLAYYELLLCKHEMNEANAQKEEAEIALGQAHQANAGLSQRLEKYKNAYNTFQSRYEQIQEKLAQYVERVKAKEATIANLENENAALAALNTSFQTTNQELFEKKEELSLDNEKLTKDLERAASKAEQQAVLIFQLQRQLEQANARAAAAEVDSAKYKDIANKIAAQTKATNALATELASL